MNKDTCRDLYKDMKTWEFTFLCPNCSSTHFGTWYPNKNTEHTEDIGECGGYDDNSNRCKFTWLRADDYKVFVTLPYGSMHNGPSRIEKEELKNE